jgi:hypothetical protein
MTKLEVKGADSRLRLANATVLVEKLTNEERKNLILYMNELIKEDLLAEFMSR